MKEDRIEQGWVMLPSLRDNKKKTITRLEYEPKLTSSHNNLTLRARKQAHVLDTFEPENNHVWASLALSLVEQEWRKKKNSRHFGF